jgi:hypothetical protein
MKLKLLSLRRAALFLGLSPLTLKTAAASGDVPVVTINGRLRFEQTALATWALGTRTAPFQAAGAGRTKPRAQEVDHE